MVRKRTESRSRLSITVGSVAGLLVSALMISNPIAEQAEASPLIPRQQEFSCGKSPMPSHPRVCAAPDPGTDWGTDIFIGRVDSGFSVTKLVSDADTNGDIYVGALGADSGPNTAVIAWRSVDGGSQWTELFRIQPGSPSARIRDYASIVGHDSAGTWMYDFLLVADTGLLGGVWLLRHRAPMQDSTWIHVVGGSDTLRSISADRNIASPEFLFLSWGSQNGLVGAASSGDAGLNWGNYRTVFTSNQCSAICAGGDSCVYVAAGRLDSAAISVARYNGNLGDSLPVRTWLDSSSSRKVWGASIAADRTGIRSQQSAVTLYCLKDENARVSPRLAWTEDGGQTWGTTLWPPVSQIRSVWNACSPYVRKTYEDDLFRGVTTMQYSGWDTLVYSVSRSENPTYWEQRLTPNDSSSAGTVAPRVGGSFSTSGGYLVYTSSGRRSAFFDGFDLVGQPEQRSPYSDGGIARTQFVSVHNPVLRLAASPGERIRVRLYGISGRQLDLPYSGEFAAGETRLEIPVRSVTKGIYFCRVETFGRSDWVKVMVVQ